MINMGDNAKIANILHVWFVSFATQKAVFEGAKVVKKSQELVALKGFDSGPRLSGYTYFLKLLYI